MVDISINKDIIRGCMLYKDCDKSCLRKTIVNSPKWFAPFLSEKIVNALDDCLYYIEDEAAGKKQDELEDLFGGI